MKIWLVIGTRPEAIKLAPVALALRHCPWAETRLILTGQHQDLVRPMLDLFGLKPDDDLAVMETAQTLAGVTARILTGLDALLLESPPDWVIGQGDTASVLAASMACFFRQVRFAHVEAGLRTGDRWLPFPEEMNRVVTAQYASLHFAPTRRNAQALLSEGIAHERIHEVGNTVIDALHWVLAQPAPDLPSRGRPYVLLTAHRRENHGEPLTRICAAVTQLAKDHPELDFLIPVHPNPAVREQVHARLAHLSNVLLLPPLPYEVFCWLMKGCLFLLSDSGGVQEEAPALGKPVLVLREETERPEAAELGATRLVGTQVEAIVSEATRLIHDSEHYQCMALAGSPYGDGKSAQRILEVLKES